MGMRCVRCSTDNNLRDRTANQGRCKNCYHPFAFEPTSVTDYRFRFTDLFFAKAIADISANDTLFFTPKQLFYLLDSRLTKKTQQGAIGIKVLGILTIFISRFITGGTGIILPFELGLTLGVILFLSGCFVASNSIFIRQTIRRGNARSLQVIGGFFLFFGIFYSLATYSFIGFVISTIVGVLSFYLGYRQLARQTKIPQAFFIPQNQFQRWLSRWQLINNPIAQMLPSPRQEIAPTAVSPDISAYSFDQVVICDNAAIAQLLIANNFHFENNCAVLSITGYPQSIFDTVMQMLSRNPNLKVYVLHDASPQGVSLVHQLRTNPNWFQNENVMIYDLGLQPRQIFKLRRAFVQGSQESAQQAKQLPPEVRQRLSRDELAWLDAGNFVELESFSPQRIIQVLNRGIAQSQDVAATDSLLLIDEARYGGVGYVYATDSFG
jgi:hypothetical protein